MCQNIWEGGCGETARKGGLRAPYKFKAEKDDGSGPLDPDSCAGPGEGRRRWMHWGTWAFQAAAGKEAGASGSSWKFNSHRELSISKRAGRRVRDYILKEWLQLTKRGQRAYWEKPVAEMLSVCPGSPPPPCPTPEQKAQGGERGRECTVFPPWTYARILGRELNLRVNEYWPKTFRTKRRPFK